MTDLATAADNAIFEAIKHDHPDFDDGWMDLVPEDSPLNYSDDQDWRHFLGDVVRRYRLKIAPCTCPTVTTFFDFKSKELLALHDALVEKTSCP